MIRVLLFLGLLVTSVYTSLTPNTFLTSEDKARLSDLFKLDEPYNDIPFNNLYYSLVGSTVLSNDKLFTILNTQQTKKICDYIQTGLAGTNPVLETIYFASSTGKLLNCQVQANAKTIAFLENKIVADVTVSDLYKSALSLINLGKPVDAPKISKLLQAGLKKDDSLLNAGHAFRLAAHLQGAGNSAPFFAKIDDVVMQADEVDGRFLQFEGGLGVTANIILGIYSLASSLNKPPGLSNEQVIKFTNYFLNRKTVQTVKGAADLLEVLKVLSQNNYHIPVCVSLYGSSSISEENPLVSVHVTNVLGQSLGSELSVSSESTLWTGKKAFKAVQGDSTMFAFDLIEIKPKRGPHSLTISVSTSKPDSKLIGNTGAEIKVIILTKVTVENAEIGIVDRDQTTSLKMTALQYPGYNKNILEVDQQQKIVMKFALKDLISGEYLTPHQVFLQILNDESKRENIYVAETESNTNIYKFDLNMAQRAKDFGHNSGLYHISLIVGDPAIANPFVWKLASLKISFSSGSTQTVRDQAPWMTATYKSKPIINHIFRQQDKRPPTVVSDAFALIVLVPVLILFVLWIKLRVNLSGFSFSLSGLIFHLGLGSIFALFTYFWLELDMFSTIKYLLGLGLVTFLSGHSLLSRLANKKSDK